MKWPTPHQADFLIALDLRALSRSELDAWLFTLHGRRTPSGSMSSTAKLLAKNGWIQFTTDLDIRYSLTPEARSIFPLFRALYSQLHPHILSKIP